MTADARPFPRLTDEEQATLLRSVRNLGRRLLLRVLLDLDRGGDLGAYPGHQLLADRTGWEPKTVRNRLVELHRAGLIVSRRGGAEGFTRYYVVPPMSRQAGTPPPEADVPTGRDVTPSAVPADVPTPRDAADVPADVPTGRDAEGVDVPDDVPDDVPTVGHSSRERDIQTPLESDATVQIHGPNVGGQYEVRVPGQGWFNLRPYRRNRSGWQCSCRGGRCQHIEVLLRHLGQEAAQESIRVPAPAAAPELPLLDDQPPTATVSRNGKRPRRSPATTPASRSTWLTPYADIYAEVMEAPMQFGRVGKALAPVEELLVQRGEAPSRDGARPLVLPVWRAYWQEARTHEEARYATAEDFARRFGVLRKRVVDPANPYDGWTDVTHEGEARK